MVRIIMHGCNGKMGQVITGLAADDPNAQIVAGIDIADNRDNGYPVFTDIKKCDVAADVIVDFAAAVAVDALLDYSVEKQIPVVLCTTGLSDEQLAKLADGCIDIYSGNDDQVVPLLSLGGKGVISVTANIAPRDVHDMVKKFMDGDVKGSLDIQLKTIDLCEALFCEVNPIPVKKAVELMGLCGGTMRMPLTEMEPAHVEKLKAAMTAYGLL